MTWFNNLRIKAKMLFSFALVIVLVVVLAVLSIVEIASISNGYRYAIEHPMEAELQMMTFISESRDLRRLTTSMVMFAPGNDPSRIDSLANEAAEAYRRGLAALDAYELTVTSGNMSEKARAALVQLGDLRSAFSEYKNEVCDPVVTASRAGDYNGGLQYAAAGAAVTNKVVDLGYDLIVLSQGSATANVASAESKTTSTIWLVAIISVAMVVISIVIAFLLSSVISRPLVPLSRFMSNAGATGDISLAPNDIAIISRYSHMHDELGMTINGCASFIKHVAFVADELETVASGDLSIDIELLSEKDVMGKSLGNMVNSLNEMFREINDSTSHVSSGSKQVANGAQALAQGSTEQAASIEELSSSIAEIAEKTKRNAETADKTAKLAESIIGNAEKGSQQMDEMMSAVQDINQASQNISKVIKVIDDIAFQTNILALNAAVEAARAGQHGKGFAVVAEEVRNLASKSAEAAKETGSMIENSIEKAELGSRIAGETASSLMDIVTGINESSDFIREIATASEEQSLGISQINTGIDQVAQVVQQNSATAQQSAAASQEMSSQSSMLEGLITRFKLRDGKARIGMPAKSSEGRFAAKEEHDDYSLLPSDANDFGKY